MAIINYANTATRDIAEHTSSKEARRLLPLALHRIAYLKLVLLHQAESLAQLASVPGLRLEKLRGSRKGQYSIRINRQYRICFRWQEKDCSDVEIVDYH